LRGVVAGSEILRSGFVRLRLALFFRFRMRLLNARRIRLRFFEMGVNVVLLGFAGGFLAYEFRGRRLVRVAQYFPWQFDRQGTGRLDLNCHRRLFVPVSVIVVFQIFENVTDIQEGIAVQADIHESRLHAG
jgi:hypothetical protein